MSSTVELGPFQPGEWDEVHLESAPLIRVLAQVRWDELTQFSNARFDEVVQQLEQRVAHAYPIKGVSKETQFNITPQGVSQSEVGTVYRFSSVEETWRFYFASTFATLETTEYTSRDDFCARFLEVLTAIAEVTSIPRVIRTGYRYVNRVHEPGDMDELSNEINPLLLGGKNLPGLDDVRVQHTLSETLYSTSKGNLLAKWAILPPGASIDPTIEGVNTNSWMLDLDAFSERKQPFSPSELIANTRELSSLGYGFFRWAVDNPFLERFGGGTK
ncbi:TIGR04255 family protein [Leifsonia sp. EB34]|uniref:TIGR04255 family protein n=1 Tax=Leifsonia sp. EB34 TaxID=3156303 RepID=UPI003515860A